jgi:hypothetical protein
MPKPTLPSLTATFSYHYAAFQRESNRQVKQMFIKASYSDVK